MAVGTGRKDPLNVVDRSSLEPGKYPIGKAIRQVEKDLDQIAGKLKAAGFTMTGYKAPTRQAIGGYVSNVQANLYNESRRAKETLVDLTSGGATRSEVTGWLSTGVFRPPLMDLSITSHARAMGRGAVWDLISQNPKTLTHVGIMMPNQALGSVSPGGALSRFVGRVFGVDEWQRISRQQNKGRRGLSLAFSLGLHHGDRHQLMPITASWLAAALETMAGYRDRMLKVIRRRNS